jgi:hypothetical protein
VILKKGKPEHAVSKPMQRRSAPRRQLQAPAKPTVASSLFKSRVLNPVHLNQVPKENNNKSNVKEEDSEFQEENENVALNTENSIEKHRKKKNEYEYGYGYKGDHYHGAQQKPYQHKGGSEPQLSKLNVKGTRSIDTLSSNSDDDSVSSRNIKYKVRKLFRDTSLESNTPQQPKKPPPIAPKPQQILITKKSALNTKPDVASRTKDFRLKDSDIYVARLGSSNVTPPQASRHQSHNVNSTPVPTPSPKSEPSSLYDELSPISRTPSPSTAPTNPVLEKPEIRASRPCYRCVSAMHAVGIKRVFWTNADGEWEGAKVRDLVEALEKGIEDDNGDGPGTGQENKGVFVTKHEILMLKRVMGF